MMLGILRHSFDKLPASVKDAISIRNEASN